MAIVEMMKDFITNILVFKYNYQRPNIALCDYIDENGTISLFGRIHGIISEDLHKTLEEASNLKWTGVGLIFYDDANKRLILKLSNTDNKPPENISDANINKDKQHSDVIKHDDEIKHDAVKKINVSSSATISSGDTGNRKIETLKVEGRKRGYSMPPQVFNGKNAGPQPLRKTFTPRTALNQLSGMSQISIGSYVTSMNNYIKDGKYRKALEVYNSIDPTLIDKQLEDLYFEIVKNGHIESIKN